MPRPVIWFPSTALALALVLTARAAAPAPVTLFDLADVTLGPGPFREAPVRCLRPNMPGRSISTG